MDNVKPSKERVCSTRTSLAWIEPSGAVHWMNGFSHRSWADVYLNAELNKEDYYKDTVKELLARGWIRVTSKSEIQMLDPDRTSQEAWDAWAEISASCVGMYDSDSGVNYSPESPVLIDYSANKFSTLQFSFADALERYCSRRVQGAIWKSALGESSVRNLVREMLLQEKTLYDVLGRGRPIPHGLDADFEKGGGLEYPQDKPTSDFRRDAKKLWNQHADHSYFQDPKKFFVYHYLGHYSYNQGLEDYFPRGSTTPGKVPGIDFPSRDELSCFGGPGRYGGGESIQLLMPFFTFKKRRVTFASSDDAGTEWLSRATPADIEKHRGSGLPKRPNVYHRYGSMPIDEEEVENLGQLEEVIIDNWVIDTFYCEKKDVKYAKELGLKYKVLGT